MSADVPPPPVVPIGPWGAGGGGVKNSKNGGVVSFVLRTATISIFLSDAKCSPICTAQTCAHSGVEPVTNGGVKSAQTPPCDILFFSVCLESPENQVTQTPFRIKRKI